jgi:hypothetical protein
VRLGADVATTRQCRNAPGCMCAYHKAIREAVWWHRWLSRHWPSLQSGGQLKAGGPEQQLEAGE